MKIRYKFLRWKQKFQNSLQTKLRLPKVYLSCSYQHLVTRKQDGKNVRPKISAKLVEIEKREWKTLHDLTCHACYNARTQLKTAGVVKYVKDFWHFGFLRTGTFNNKQQQDHLWELVHFFPWDRSNRNLLLHFLTNRLITLLLFNSEGNLEKDGLKLARARFHLVGQVWSTNVLPFSWVIPTGLLPIGFV